MADTGRLSCVNGRHMVECMLVGCEAVVSGSTVDDIPTVHYHDVGVCRSLGCVIMLQSRNN